jgi:hypothetical protein
MEPSANGSLQAVVNLVGISDLVTDDRLKAAASTTLPNGATSPETGDAIRGAEIPVEGGCRLKTTPYPAGGSGRHAES